MEPAVLDSALEPIYGLAQSIVAQDEIVLPSEGFQNDLVDATSESLTSTSFSIEYFIGLFVLVVFLYLIYRAVRGLAKKVHHGDEK